MRPGQAVGPAMFGAAALVTSNPDLSPAQFAVIAAIMQSDARIELVPSKTTLVHSRLTKRLRAHGLQGFSEYLKLVRSDPGERAAMVVALTTNHTHFFREGHHFDHLRDEVLPLLKQRAQSRLVRLWSAGCSSGEEIYTAAMTLAGTDRAGAAWLAKHSRLLATDLAPHVVAAVSRGVYSAATIKPIPPAMQRAWLRPEGPDFAIAGELRDAVTARVLNLFGPWPMRQKYDVIFCRNVMIYFDRADQAELQSRLIDMLVPGGHLYIGHSERLSADAARQMRPAGHTIYLKPEYPPL